MNNLVRLAWRNIRSRRARSWLTVLGVLIGVTAIVALISIGAGVRRSVLKQFETIGYDLVVLSGGTGQRGEVPQRPDVQGAPGSSRVLDLTALRRAVPAIGDMGALANVVLPISTETLSGSLRVVGANEEFLKSFGSLLGSFRLAAGTGFSTSSASEAIVGGRTAERLGLSVGSTLEVAGSPFVVVGVLEATAPPVQAGPAPATGSLARTAAGSQGLNAFRALTNTDDAIFVPYEQLSRLTGQASPSTVAIRIRKGLSVSDAVSGIRAELARQGVQMNVISTEELAKSIQSGIGLIEGVLASIAGISLLVGAVGMMNTMYTAVLERRREIGILKAVGATDGQVLALFVIDSGLMGLAGGFLGLVFGAGLSMVGASVLGRVLAGGSFRPVFGADLIVGVLGLSFVLGAVSGTWPAWNASRMEPVQALTEE